MTIGSTDLQGSDFRRGRSPNMMFQRNTSSVPQAQSTTSFLRHSKNNRGSVSHLEEDVSERDSEVDKQPKPQFNSECFRRMELMIEFANLRNPKHCPSGVYVMPAADNFHKWFGVIFVHKGYYKKGVFKFQKRPSVSFSDSELFHPLIDPNTGNFSLAHEFKDWTPHKYYIFHILHYIKRSFKKLVLDNLNEKYCLNKKAYTTYRDEIHTFAKMAKQCADLSISGTKLYEDHSEVKEDANPIRFAKLDTEDFEELEKLKKTYLIPPASPDKEKERTPRRPFASTPII
ncbi:13093_t:CDS:2 [Ambispora gerdemannii]|uniref:13093_t:CDS:1 n=1 Tax=Ambispora gerdemannii TaxID=144530 RepID=A0A9N8WKP3_9GLOM|nr:13093_t:CDS:2 [Ambispora gerdemannii]